MSYLLWRDGASALGAMLAEVSVSKDCMPTGAVAVAFAVNEYLAKNWAAIPVDLSCPIDLESIRGAPLSHM